jgi:hypothetical protein
MYKKGRPKMDYESLHPKYKEYYDLLKKSQDLNFQLGIFNNEILRFKISMLWWFSKKELDILAQKAREYQDIHANWKEDLWEFYWNETKNHLENSLNANNPSPLYLEHLMNVAKMADDQMIRVATNINHEYSNYDNKKSFGIAIISGIVSLIGLIISLGATIPVLTLIEWISLWITPIAITGSIIFIMGIIKMNLGKTQKWILCIYSSLFFWLCIWVPWVYIDSQGHPIKRIGNHLIMIVPKNLPHLTQAIDTNRLILEIIGITIPAMVLVLTFKRTLTTKKGEN